MYCFIFTIWLYVVMFTVFSARSIMGRPKKTAAASSPKKVKSPKMKSERKKKDPNAPKRAQSAYMLWLNENRSKLAKPGMSVVDVSRAAGVEWATVKDKSKWEKQAAEEKKRYEKEMAAYKAGGSASSPKKAGKVKAK
ncbi:HMG box [Dictyocaulus viviparus]|uniref:HMG box n=1 Tax=Dictyocaulus viviparus TaxID=29172 RepID=A0A0D8Y867_DICVI|nr:HMG box [Dictyocaulus viviparus]